jgi:hypothetical protein
MPAQVSDSPYISTTSQPVTAFQRSAVARRSAVPPWIDSFSPEKSSAQKSGELSSASYSVLTPAKIDGR